MALRLVTPPSVDPVMLDEAKAQLRIDHADEDVVIARLIKTATQALDGAGSWLGRALISQTWALDLESFPPCREVIKIPLPPLIAVTSVSYRDDSGATQTLDPARYEVLDNGLQPSEIWQAWNANWPRVNSRPRAVTIQFNAGFGVVGTDIPEPIRHAILLLIGHFYENREATAPGNVLPELIPLAYDALLSPYRILTII